MRITLASLPPRCCFLVLAALASAACAKGRDETQVGPPQATSAGGTGAASGSSGASAGGSGGGGDGGSGTDSRDASTEPLPERCQPLESYCNTPSASPAPRCPDLAAVLASLRRVPNALIVQRRCRASDGSPLLRVGATYDVPGYFAQALIYDPGTGDLVGREFTDDVSYSCFGDISRDCASTSPYDYLIDCAGLDAGAFGDAASVACERVAGAVAADGGVIADAGL